jgi:hypothetical protein
MTQMMEVEENREDYVLLLNNMRSNLTFSKGQVEELREEVNFHRVRDGYRTAVF